ncbi:MAG: dihydrodipicolinate synthase family protein [Terriglobia bacterium]
MNLENIDAMRKPRRRVEGISAVLLPYDADGRIDEGGFRQHLRRTLDAGLRVAVNMDTGYGDLLTPQEKRCVLDWTADTVAGDSEFVAGALPPEGEWSCAAYERECASIREAHGVPIIFPSQFTARLGDDEIVKFFAAIGQTAGKFLAFELGSMFNPNGRMFSERVLRALIEMPECAGLKHSSLDRLTELDRVRLRDAARPGFAIYSGNDLAADMVEYGCDYLLGLSTCAPELFRERDRAWAEGRATYFELRDAIQYLGWVIFREPVPAYKHAAAIFLKAAGGLACDEPHPRAARRESWDRPLLADAARRLARVCPSAVAGAA